MRKALFSFYCALSTILILFQRAGSLNGKQNGKIIQSRELMFLLPRPFPSGLVSSISQMNYSAVRGNCRLSPLLARFSCDDYE